MTNLPATILEADFSPRYRIYLFLFWTLYLTILIVTIPLLPLWLLIGPWWIRRYFASLGCVLTERSVLVRRGTIFRREMTIPLDKIQDISLRQGPLLRRFGLLHLKIETAGQSSSATGKSEADLVGLLDARQVRDRILEQRDKLAAEATPTRGGEGQLELLAQIRDSLRRIEAGAGGGDGRPG